MCFWEDDAVQLRWPTYEGGANGPSLVESQRSYAEHGATEYRFTGLVPPATEKEPLDTGWRTVDLERDSFEAKGERKAPLAERPHDVVLVAADLLAITCTELALSAAGHTLNLNSTTSPSAIT